jgi:hypothetical protein
MGHYEAAELLVNAGADVNTRCFISDDYWTTPLSESIECGENMKVTELLIKNKASIIDAEKGSKLGFIDQAKDIRTAVVLSKLGFSTNNAVIAADIAHNISISALTRLTQRGETAVPVVTASLQPTVVTTQQEWLRDPKLKF